MRARAGSDRDVEDEYLCPCDISPEHETSSKTPLRENAIILCRYSSYPIQGVPKFDPGTQSGLSMGDM